MIAWTGEYADFFLSTTTSPQAHASKALIVSDYTFRTYGKSEVKNAVLVKCCARTMIDG